ncbi:MAG: adenosylcobinamide-GDP ribazoletransferase [Lachnospiraceae bacterium]|nr:adenosylcobinamide-GDP ribazoletransferase [Lachnospiraceae bacterium]
MGIIKPFFIAFSLYSQIPVPQFEWKEEDMKYMLCFFPWIGVVIGVLLFGWRQLCHMFSIGETGYLLIAAAIPLLVTGGFHVDGFMDTMDALHSYQSRERKLEILKDSHIGAFSVIMLAAYGLVYLGAFSEVRNNEYFTIVCTGFFLSRCLSGISVVSFPAAKKEGLLHSFAAGAEKKRVRWILVLQAAAGVLFMLMQSITCAIILTLCLLLLYAYYHHRCKREFGGITGDTAGCLVLLLEAIAVAVAAIMDIAG